MSTLGKPCCNQSLADYQKSLVIQGQDQTITQTVNYFWSVEHYRSCEKAECPLKGKKTE